MSYIRLCAGLVRNGKWFNYTEVEPLKGGVLALFDSPDKSGGAKILSLMQGVISKVYTTDKEEYALQQTDYQDLTLADIWRISREVLKMTTKSDYPVFPEHFLCSRCSYPGQDRYTEVRESWDKLIEEGVIDEVYLEEAVFEYKVELPDPIIVPPGKTIIGGTFHTIYKRYMTLGDLLKLQKNSFANQSEANMIACSWDLLMTRIEGMVDRDFNVLVKRDVSNSFSKKYLSSNDNLLAIEEADEENAIGLVAKYRQVYCKYCNAEIGGFLDFTNFFSLLLPKKQDQFRTRR